MTLSVIGAGLGRTGCLSLKLALERLGFGPCYHTRELLKQLDAHVAVWNRAADGDFVDWDALYEGYSSAVDFPRRPSIAKLSGHYPAAKVILTLRDPARWYESVKETILWPLTRNLCLIISRPGKRCFGRQSSIVYLRVTFKIGSTL